MFLFKLFQLIKSRRESNHFTNNPSLKYNKKRPSPPLLKKIPIKTPDDAKTTPFAGNYFEKKGGMRSTAHYRTIFCFRQSELEFQFLGIKTHIKAWKLRIVRR